MFNILSKISLSSWDEAWYGAIAKNIYKSGDFFHLVYNGNPFFDHPPFVFWLQVISFKIFGVSEFAVRFPSFLLGLASVFIVYLIAKEMFGKTAGLFAGVSLFTAPWFLTRSLSGNLDIPLTFLFLLSFYFAIKVRSNFSFLIPLSFSLSFLFLTKSLVPFTILPVLAFMLWGKLSFKQLLFLFSVFLFLTLPWFIYTQINYPEFIFKYLSIGYPGANVSSNIWQNILLTKTYLHNGIGNWFWWGVLSLIFGFLFHKKKYLSIIIFVATFLLPFAFSNKGHIWHLIPLYPFWILSLFGLLEITAQKYKFILMLILFLLISSNQIKRNWYEVIMAPGYKSDIQILSEKSKEFKSIPLYLDDDSLPEAVFYSDRDRIERIANRGDVRKMFDTDENSFLLITRDWRLNEENIKTNEFTLIAKDRDKVLILKK